MGSGRFLILITTHLSPRFVQVHLRCALQMNLFRRVVPGKLIFYEITEALQYSDVHFQHSSVFYRVLCGPSHKFHIQHSPAHNPWNKIFHLQHRI